MITKGLGFIESGVNPNDAIYAAPKIELPKRYELREQLRVYDQGSKGSCVSCTVAEMYNFYFKSKGREPSIGFEYLYDQRSDKTIDGMMPREAFEILKGEHRVEVFARIGSLDALKKSVLTNGAALIAMNVFSYNDDFWNGDEFMGGHAVAVVGYDETGLIIKNSWGTSMFQLMFIIVQAHGLSYLYRVGRRTTLNSLTSMKEVSGRFPPSYDSLTGRMSRLTPTPLIEKC